MENLSLVGSLNNDTVAPCYDSDILSEVPHYNTYHNFDVLNSNIQELGYIENIVSTNESYDELKGNSDDISYTDYMLTIRDDVDNYVPHPVQKDDMMLSVIEQMKSQVEKYNKVNEESKSEIESLTSELERYKDRVKFLGYAVKDDPSEQEAYLNHKLYTVINDRLLKIQTEPINEYFKNNRDVHRDYLRVTKEHVATLQELLEQARALKPLDDHIGRVSSTNASGSKPRSNTKNDRIPQPSSRSKKNKVEAHHRKFKSSANKNNHVLDCNVNVKNVALSKNSDTIWLSCNECLFSANHDACVVQYLKKLQKRKVAKSTKQKVKKEWKPT
ncbi:hypothetical protein Tco_0809340 [Tanacetum coccineum]